MGIMISQIGVTYLDLVKNGHIPWGICTQIFQSHSEHLGLGTCTGSRSRYPLVNQHSNGTSPFPIGNTSSKGPFSIAILDYRSAIQG